MQHCGIGSKMETFLLFVLLTACTATPQDLSGKVFTFPQETNSASVSIDISSENLNAATVCLRFFTDLARSHSLFSLATPSYDNHFVIYKDTVADALDLTVGNENTQFFVLDYKLNVWHSVCSTWVAESGLAQLWFDGKPSVRKFTSGSQISQPIVILGQEQDTYGGGFDSTQSFVGMISDVHMWNYILSPCEIQRYVDDLNFSPGNVLNWMALTFDVSDRVLIEDKQKTC